MGGRQRRAAGGEGLAAEGRVAPDVAPAHLDLPAGARLAPRPQRRRARVWRQLRSRVSAAGKLKRAVVAWYPLRTAASRCGCELRGASTQL